MWMAQRAAGILAEWSIDIQSKKNIWKQLIEHAKNFLTFEPVNAKS